MVHAPMEQHASQALPNGRSRRYRPAVDVVEREGELMLVMDMPGLSHEGIDIQFENGVLTVLGPVPQRVPEGANLWLGEYGVGDFYRAFQIGDQFDSRQIHAEYQAGVLTVHLPKAEALKPRKIAVKVE